LGPSPVAPGQAGKQAGKQAGTAELATIGGKPSPGINHPYRRSKSKTTQVTVITALVLAVMVLLIIFIWVVSTT
jgi:hypothetical protein